MHILTPCAPVRAKNSGKCIFGPFHVFDLTLMIYLGKTSTTLAVSVVFVLCNYTVLYLVCVKEHEVSWITHLTRFTGKFHEGVLSAFSVSDKQFNSFKTLVSLVNIISK